MAIYSSIGGVSKEQHYFQTSIDGTVKRIKKISSSVAQAEVELHNANLIRPDMVKNARFFITSVYWKKYTGSDLESSYTHLNDETYEDYVSLTQNVSYYKDENGVYINLNVLFPSGGFLNHKINFALLVDNEGRYPYLIGGSNDDVLTPIRNKLVIQFSFKYDRFGVGGTYYTPITINCDGSLKSDGAGLNSGIPGKTTTYPMAVLNYDLTNIGAFSKPGYEYVFLLTNGSYMTNASRAYMTQIQLAITQVTLNDTPIDFYLSSASNFNNCNPLINISKSFLDDVTDVELFFTSLYSEYISSTNTKTYDLTGSSSGLTITGKTIALTDPGAIDHYNKTAGFTIRVKKSDGKWYYAHQIPAVLLSNIKISFSAHWESMIKASNVIIEGFSQTSGAFIKFLSTNTPESIGNSTKSMTYKYTINTTANQQAYANGSVDLFPVRCGRLTAWASDATLSTEIPPKILPQCFTISTTPIFQSGTAYFWSSATTTCAITACQITKSDGTTINPAFAWNISGVE